MPADSSTVDDASGMMNEDSIDYSEYEEADISRNSTVYNNGNNHLHARSNNISSSSSSSLVGGGPAGVGEDDSLHIKTIEQAIARLKKLHEATEWDKVISNEKNVTVYVQKSIVDVKGKQKKVPLFRGEKFIEGYNPEQVFEVVGRRSLWDDWYDSGNLVADLNNSTSMTYMNMRVPGTARPRDLSLIERVEASSDGTVWFAATSIETSKVPHVHGRTRAHMVLNGWVLKPLEKNGILGTLCFYYLQVDPLGLTPFGFATKIISKRLAHIYKIEDYLNKNGGPPRSAGTGQRPPQQQHHHQQRVNGQAGAFVAGSSSATHDHDGKHGARDEATIASGRGPSLPPHAAFNEEHSSGKALQEAKHKFEQLLNDNTNRWMKAVDPNKNPLYWQKTETNDNSELVFKGEAKLGPEFTTEQVIGTLHSSAARAIWDEHLQSTQTLENINGAEQCIRQDIYKGIHPHLGSRTYTVAQGAFRSDLSSDNGNITGIVTSVAPTSTSTSNGQDSNESSTNESASSTSKDHIHFAGWRVSTNNTDTSNVHIEHALHATVDSRGKPIPDFIQRILLVGHAGSPAKLASFIQNHGHAPYFLRWGPGAVRLEGEKLDAGDLTQGELAWRISGSGKSTQVNDKSDQQYQLAWLQYSSTMYPKGISLDLEGSASDGIKAAKVKGFSNIVQITFPISLSADELILRAGRYSGESPDDVAWNGSPLSETVEPPQGAKAITRIPAAQTQGPPVAAALANGTGSNTEVVRTSRGRTDDADFQHGVREAATAVSASGSRQLNDLSQGASDLATIHHLPTDAKGRRQLPDDAMLILTRDLYFTRSQVAVVAFLLLSVWCSARYF